MGGRAKWFGSPAQQLVMAAVLALVIGLLTYLLTRPPGSVILLGWLPELGFFPHLTGNAFLQSLPSLLHTYAFILLTFTALSSRLDLLRPVCLFWVFLELLLELGQRADLALEIAYRLPDWVNHTPVLNLVPGYFLNGRYDPLDQMFILFGALAACATVLVSRIRNDASTHRSVEPPVAH